MSERERDRAAARPGSQEARRIPPRTRSVSRIPVEKENRTKVLFSFFAAVSVIDTAFALANAWVRESATVFSEFLLQNILLYGKMKIPKT